MRSRERSALLALHFFGPVIGAYAEFVLIGAMALRVRFSAVLIAWRRRLLSFLDLLGTWLEPRVAVCVFHLQPPIWLELGGAAP